MMIMILVLILEELLFLMWLMKLFSVVCMLLGCLCIVVFVVCVML